MPPECPNVTRLVGRMRKVTQPSLPVAASAGVVVVPNGSETTNTSAPWTEWLRLSDTWNRAVNVVRERSGWGVNCRRSTSSRFGSDTSAIDTVAPPGASALPMTALGADVDDDEPRALRPVTRTRSVVPSSTDVSTYVFAVALLMSAQFAPVLVQRRQ